MMSVHVIGNQSHRSLHLGESYSVTSSTHQTDCSLELNLANVCLFWLDTPPRNQLLDVRRIKTNFVSLPVVVVANSANADTVRQAMRCKAWDFVVIPEETEHLRQILAMFSTKFDANRDGRGTTTQRNVNFPPTSSPGPTNPHKLRTTAAVEYISKNYAAGIEVPKLASLCAMSQSAFAVAFKAEQGCTTSAYIGQYRIDKAIILLRTTDLMIKDIAFKVGYQNESYFTRVFKDNMGVTPNTFRNSLREKQSSRID